jgi:hypothetical protein
MYLEMSFISTYEWLQTNLELTRTDANMPSPDVLIRNGSTWTHIAGMRKSLSIYTNEIQYCAHAGDEWPVDTEPLFGYFDISLDYNALLCQLAEKYDAMSDIRRQAASCI